MEAPDREWRASIMKMLSDGKADPDFLKHPNIGTASAQRFFDDLGKTHGVIGLLGVLTNFAGSTIEVVSAISKAIADINRKNDKTGAPSVEEASSIHNAEAKDILKAFERVSPVVLQMVIVRTADNFTSYLSDIIRECIEAEPKLLRSKETLTYEEILNHSTLEELKESLIERKMSTLGYSGFGSLSDWFDERLGISDLRANIAWKTINELVEARNCIVHNSCCASAKYLRAIGREVNKSTVGRPIEIDVEFGFVAYCATAECVTALDDVIAQKFQLNRSPLQSSDLDKEMFGFSYPLKALT